MQVAVKFLDSLADLQTSYLDLYLLHYPSCGGSLCSDEERVTAGTWQTAWRELEELVAAGKIRALGKLDWRNSQGIARFGAFHWPEFAMSSLDIE